MKARNFRVWSIGHPRWIFRIYFLTRARRRKCEFELRFRTVFVTLFTVALVTYKNIHLSMTLLAQNNKLSFCFGEVKGVNGFSIKFTRSEKKNLQFVFFFTREGFEILSYASDDEVLYSQKRKQFKINLCLRNSSPLLNHFKKNEFQSCWPKIFKYKVNLRITPEIAHQS